MGVRKLSAFAELTVELDPVPLPMSDRFVAVSDSRELRGDAADSHDIDDTGTAGSHLSLRSRNVPREAVRRSQRQAAALLTRLAAQNRLQPLAAAVEGFVGLIGHLVDREDERAALELPLQGLDEAAQSAGRELRSHRSPKRRCSCAMPGATSERRLWAVAAAVSRCSPSPRRAAGHFAVSFSPAWRATDSRVRCAPTLFFPTACASGCATCFPICRSRARGTTRSASCSRSSSALRPRSIFLTPRSDEDGKPLSPSSFLDELRRAGRIGAALPALEPDLPSALDLACRAALEGERSQHSALQGAFEEAYREGEERFTPADLPSSNAESAAGWAASHLALLAEVSADPLAPQAAALGPFFGFVGGMGPRFGVERAAQTAPDLTRGDDAADRPAAAGGCSSSACCA